MIGIALNYLIKHKLVPLPCMGKGDKKGKTPIVKWREIQELPHPDQVREWFKRNPDANLGFKTGKVSGILALDDDGVGITEPIPLTPVARSIPGHFHYYFKNPDFYVPPSASKIGPHLDIRCDQAFIVAPPSKHFNKKTGEVDGEYQWCENLSPDDLPFAPCPDWLITKIKATLEATHGFDWSTSLNVGIGARDETLTKAAASLIAKGFEYDLALSILRGINSTYNPPLEDSLVVNKLKTAIEFIKSQRESQSRATLYTKRSDTTGVVPKVEPKLITDLEISEGNDVSWVWEGFLARSHITLLSALWKSGKTVFLTYFLKRLQNGEDFCSKKTIPCKVLIVSEESEIIWARRREEYDLNYPIWILSRPIRARLSYREWVKFLEDIAEFCSKEKIDLFILDTLSAFWSVTNESDASEMQAALLPLNNLLQRDLACFLIHHHRKSGGAEGTAARGSGALGSHVDIMVDFERMAGDPETTQRKLTAYSRFEETPRQIVVDFVDGEYITLGSPAEVNKQQKFNVVLDILKEAGDGMTVQDILQSWDSEENGKRPSKRTLQRYLSEMAETNQVINAGTKEISGGIASIYKPAPTPNYDKSSLKTKEYAQDPRQARSYSIEPDTSQKVEDLSNQKISQIFEKGE